jgi:hypothetical protein
MMRRWLIVVGLLATLNGAGAEKWALLVGINDYTHGPEQWDLRGCENDVHMTRDLLVGKYGFPAENIRVLLSGEATAANIKAGIEDWLIAKTKPQDIVYFHFSGHGSQVTDYDGDELENEEGLKDGKDEMICPADMQRGNQESIITDDQLRDLLAQIPANNLTVVMDACHSGTITRDLSLSKPRGVEFGEVNDERAVVMTATARPVAAGTSVQPSPVHGEAPSQTAPPSKFSGSGGMEVGKQGQVLISGCKSEQTSADAWIREGFYAGALTFHLIENMKKAPADITYRELMDRVIRDMQQKYAQSPQIEGDMNRPLFGTVVSAVATPFVEVAQVRGEIAVLKGGAAQNITVGSVYAVYPAGETEFRDQPLGQIRVSRVEVDWSEAEIIGQAKVQPGFRAQELMHRLEVEHLNLLVEGEESIRAAIIEALADVDIVKAVAPGMHFDHRLQISTEKGFLHASLTLDGESGTPVMGANAAILVSNLRPQLENAYAIKFLVHLENPNPAFKVEVWGNRSVGASELDNAPDEKWVEANVGDAIRFNFRAERDCYLTLINVGTSGKITVLFPNKYQPDGQIQAGKVYRTETPGEMPFKIRAHAPAGRELVKVVATLKPLNLNSLKMGQAGGAGTRSIESGSRFAQQLSRDLAIEGLEDQGTDVTLLPTGTWASDFIIIDTTE